MDVNNSLGNLQDVNSRHVNSVFNKRWDVQLSWAFALTRVWGSFTCLGSFRSLHQFTRSSQIVDTLHLTNTSTNKHLNKKHKSLQNTSHAAARSHWFTRKIHTHHCIDVAPHVLVPPPSTIKLAKLYDSKLCCSPKNICMFYTFALLVYMPIDVYVPPLQRPSLTCLTNTSTTLTLRVISRHSPHNRDQRLLVCVWVSPLCHWSESRHVFE